MTQKPILLSLAALMSVALSPLILPQAAMAQPLPEGSYLDSCRDIDIQRSGGRGPILVARCRTKSGYYNNTSIALRDCRGEIENNKGNLTCRGGSGGSGGGGYYPDRRGHGRSSITLYDREGFNGRSVTLDGAIGDLSGMRFNDAARSLDVSGRGRWEVCENAHFRGHCVVVDGSLPSLNRTGLSGHISSARPIN